MVKDNGLFDPDSYPRVILPWRLRNDQKNLVLYNWAADDVKYRVLSPFQALIIPYFNGKRKLSEILTIWLSLIKNLSNNREKQFAEILIDLLIPDKIIDIKGESSITPSNENSFLPDFKNYIFPVERTELPIVVAISLSNKCPADCIYCYAERRKDIKEMPYEQWVSFFDKLHKYKIGIVDIEGADPLIRTDSFAILKALVDRGFAFTLSTKSYISPDKAAQLCRLNIGKSNIYPNRILQLSIDSIDDKVAATITGIPNFLNLAKQSVKNLLTVGITPRIKAVLTSINFNSIENFVSYFDSMGIKEIEFVPYMRSLYKHIDTLFLSVKNKAQLPNLIKPLAVKYSNINIFYQDETEYYAKKTKEEWDDRPQCSGGRTECLIMPNGDVMLCGQLPHEEQYVVGNILETDLREIWKGKRLEKFLHPEKRKFIGSPCYNCEEFDNCNYGQGYCYRASLLGFGTIHTTPPQCYKVKNQSLRIV